MAESLEQARENLIERLVNYVLSKLPASDIPHLSRFIRLYYQNVPADELQLRSIEDLYGALMSNWQFLQVRADAIPKVRVFNPDLDSHTWQSEHSIIEILSPDMPFVMDSVRLELLRQGLTIHLSIQLDSLSIKRNQAGMLEDFNSSDPASANTELSIFVEIDRIDQSKHESLVEALRQVICLVNDCVSDWPMMKSTVQDLIDSTEFKAGQSEELAFLHWLKDDHFTFLGSSVLKFERSAEMAKPETLQSLGLCKTQNIGVYDYQSSDPDQLKLLDSTTRIIIGKTDTRSQIHRPAILDFISIRRPSSDESHFIELRLIGLFTSVVYHNSPSLIPMVREKIQALFQVFGFDAKSHNAKTLANIVDTLPRDELIQMSLQDLHQLSSGILFIQERLKLRFFARMDLFKRYVSCLVYVPREIFNSQLRHLMQDILLKAYQGTGIEFSTLFSESVLARIHFIVRLSADLTLPDQYQIEQDLNKASKSWTDHLKDASVSHWGEARGLVNYHNFAMRFPLSYQETFQPLAAINDLPYLQALLAAPNDLQLSLSAIQDSPQYFSLKIFKQGNSIPLSDVIPIIENMHFKIISEKPYQLHPNPSEPRSKPNFINDYLIEYLGEHSLELSKVTQLFIDAFNAVWLNQAENDSFNKLVLASGLTWREVSVIRAYTKYLWQINYSISQNFIADTLLNHAEIASEWFDLFKLKFAEIEGVRPEFNSAKYELLVDKVNDLTEDKILRQYLALLKGTLRTNYFQLTNDGLGKDYLSLKFQSSSIPELPLPHPLYEIFVYAPYMEGIHLRMNRVARGGIRYSDRKEDFRTEVLGLMKAQQVKNALIVPVGAKGGFVVKTSLEGKSREAINQEVLSCYQTLISGLLDITDNIFNQEHLAPKHCQVYDDFDPYLVVAADKGTASFSDTANQLAKQYNFWLGDAFASGGSAGYDHKKLGITAKGAFESVIGHFLELGVDCLAEDFTAIGIGDMAGDVFGNGLLLSQHYQLIAAFNHAHIFLDPKPDAKQSYQERLRLFALPRSSWTDYDTRLISPGGGIFARTLKSIPLSAEIKTALGIKQDKLSPAELIKAILSAPVDLLWNGGIGTYVKASFELHSQVNDRSNDLLRIDGNQLRAKVVGEGGNLGFTQLARIEYALNGGRINTDAIDNSGGVNCSDNEVNLKILFSEALQSGQITLDERNQILQSMQDEVLDLVLANNRRQNNAISLTLAQSQQNFALHVRVLEQLEKEGKINREIEFLPSKAEILKRKSTDHGLTRPEIAVIMAYLKNNLKKDLLSANYIAAEYTEPYLAEAFPKRIGQQYRILMQKHKLKAEIIAMQISNTVIDEMGISFVQRLKDETGSSTVDIVQAYLIAVEVFDAKGIRSQIEGLKNQIEANCRYQLIIELNRVLRRASRWFLCNQILEQRVDLSIQQYSQQVKALLKLLPECLPELALKDSLDYEQKLIQQALPASLARHLSQLQQVFFSLDLLHEINQQGLPLDSVARVFYALGQDLELDWFRDQIKQHSVSNHWEALARAAFRDDLDYQQSLLAIALVKTSLAKASELEAKAAEFDLKAWTQLHSKKLKRWYFFITELKSNAASFTMIAVALRELANLINQIK